MFKEERQLPKEYAKISFIRQTACQPDDERIVRIRNNAWELLTSVLLEFPKRINISSNVEIPYFYGDDKQAEYYFSNQRVTMVNQEFVQVYPRIIYLNCP